MNTKEAGEATALYNPIPGCFPGLLLDLRAVFTGSKMPSSSCSRRGLHSGESQNPLPHQDHLNQSGAEGQAGSPGVFSTQNLTRPQPGGPPALPLPIRKESRTLRGLVSQSTPQPQ